MDKGGAVAVEEKCRVAFGAAVQDVRLEAKLDGGIGREEFTLFKGHPGDPHLTGADWQKERKNHE